MNWDVVVFFPKLNPFVIYTINMIKAKQRLTVDEEMFNILFRLPKVLVRV